MADDGYAQQEYGLRLENQVLRAWSKLDRSNSADLVGWEAEFALMQDTFISAIQNGSIRSAGYLGETLLMRTPKRDAVEAMAWLRIEERMGGRTLSALRSSGALISSPEQNEESELLAEWYATKFALEPLFTSESLEDPSEPHPENLANQNCSEPEQ